MSGIGPPGSPARIAELRAQLARVPGDRVARHNLAVELRSCGFLAEASAEIERAWSEGLRAPETAVMRGHLAADLGDYDRAIAAYREALNAQPTMIEAHRALAGLLPQLGRRDEALDSYRTALARVPQTGIIWVEAMAAAKGHGDHAQLLAWAEAAEARFGKDTLITTLAANALSGLGRDSEARARLAAALEIEPDYAAGQATLAHILLRLGDPGAAAQAALQTTRLAPNDQSGWALLGTAWRLLEDEREHWLCDYERLVQPIELGLEPRLAGTLLGLHQTSAAPADQSLRGGTQTRGNLFETADPVIRACAAAIRDAIEELLRRLPSDPGHPFLSRNTGRIAFSASWSVRLAASGYHISHMHPAGWLSSACYVSLPPEVAEGSGQGALAFGVPDAALGLDLPPRRVVQPREGLLVLFPSYMWHGTTPFESAAARLTIAFDAVPVDNQAAQG